MGALTRGEIVAAALQLAGQPILTTQAGIWLNAFLNKVYSRWNWPFLLESASGISLPAGSAGVLVGAGSGGITAGVVKVTKAAIAEPGTDKDATPLALRGHMDLLPNDDPAWSRSATGRPWGLLVDATPQVVGQWKLAPLPQADKAYLLVVKYQPIIAPLTSDLQIPLYPSDETLVQAVYSKALRYNQDERWLQEAAALQNMISDDVVTYGAAPGHNQVLGLDEEVFRSG